MLLQVGGVCCMCANQPIQACSCCPKGFCADHAVSEAHNAMHPISYGKCEMFICNFCQYNSDRIQASHTHAACLNQDCYPQELFTADGLWLSMYLKNPGPPLTVDDFCAQCYRRDLAVFEQKVCVQNRVELSMLSLLEENLSTIPHSAGSRVHTLDQGWQKPWAHVLAEGWNDSAQPRERGILRLAFLERGRLLSARTASDCCACLPKSYT